MHEQATWRKEGKFGVGVLASIALYIFAKAHKARAAKDVPARGLHKCPRASHRGYTFPWRVARVAGPETAPAVVPADAAPHRKVLALCIVGCR